MKLYSKKAGEVVQYGPLQVASGTFGFFGEWYWYQKLLFPFIIFLKLFATFTSKTATLHALPGNMELDNRYTPKDRFPKCIYVSVRSWLHAGMLNAIGLSNPGIQQLWNTGHWSVRTSPYFLSIMPVGKTAEERLQEIQDFVAFFKGRLDVEFFQAEANLGTKYKVAGQLNISCPNTGHKLQQYIQEVWRWLDELGKLGIPFVVKVVCTMPVVDAKKIADHQACAGLYVSNTIPFEQLPEAVRTGHFGSKESPLKRRGLPVGGGYSGKCLLPKVILWLREARAAGIEKPIVAGGGILSAIDVWRAWRAGASAVGVASICILRPFQIPLVVVAAHILFRLPDSFRQRNVSQRHPVGG